MMFSAEAKRGLHLVQPYRFNPPVVLLPKEH